MSLVRLTIEQYGDVRRLRMSSIGSRAAGLDVSAYVFDGVMVDSGFHRARRELLDAVRRLGVRGAIITHWHEDHAGNVAALAARGIPIRMRADTEATLRRRPPVQLYRRVVWGYGAALADKVVAFDESGLEVIHTPGHSEDHQIVWHAATRTLFSGDLWLGVKSRVFHASEDPFAIVDSLRRAAALDPARMFDAHRGPVERPAESLEARARWLSKTIDDIAGHIAAGRSDALIVRRVLGGEERSAYVSSGDYARRNLVKAIRRRLAGVRGEAER